MPTAKHYSFCSSPMINRPVDDLPGIGAVYRGNLQMNGITSAKQIYDKFKSFGFDSRQCQSWLYSVSNANSRYAGMCYEALKTWHQQFGEDSYSPQKTQQSTYRSPLQQLERSEAQCSPWSGSTSSAAQSPASSSRADITKAEVMQMMAEFRSKQDAMATRINNLEQEKLSTANRIKTLESKIEVMDKKATEMQKRQNTKIAALTHKLNAIERAENYKNISSSVYMLDQKLDDLITQLNETKLNSSIITYVQHLENKIDQAERNAKKIQNQHEEKMSLLNNKIVNPHTQTNRFNEIRLSVEGLAGKFDEVIKQQRKNQQDKLTSDKTIDAKLKQLEQELGKLTVEVQHATDKRSGTMKSKNDEKEIELVGEKTNGTTRETETCDKLKATEVSSAVLEEEIVGKDHKMKNEKPSNVRSIKTIPLKINAPGKNTRRFGGRKKLETDVAATAVDSSKKLTRKYDEEDQAE